MSWAPGTIVVCIDDNWSNEVVARSPRIGEYFTVLRCFPDSDFYSGVGVMLNEYGTDVSFCSQFFRKAESDHSEASSTRTKAPAEAGAPQ